jgi:hypothetical protein
MYEDKRTRSPLSAFIVRMTCKERHNKGFGTWLWASSTVELSCPVFSVITLRKVIWNRRFGTTVSSCRAAWLLKSGHIGCPETSVSNHLTPHINPEDRRMWFRTYVLLWHTSGILWWLLSKRDAFWPLCFDHGQCCSLQLQVVYGYTSFRSSPLGLRVVLLLCVSFIDRYSVNKYKLPRLLVSKRLNIVQQTPLIAVSVCSRLWRTVVENGDSISYWLINLLVFYFYQYF